MAGAVFDYITASKNMGIPMEVMFDIETQVKRDFPHDDMLMELHVLRALREYARQSPQGDGHEN